MGRRRFHTDGAHAVVPVQGRPVVLRWWEARAVPVGGAPGERFRLRDGAVPHVMGRAGFTA
ncbi:hypothetical protein [Streptosporangium minutum]|uniref:Uncharacterized protein n=1 Tax=Streptosporangium minutum TaxID=569862 RepID=A0A243RAG3_9ACTN|nr:hypothetical protein [Streptosporangium minutum]OUC91631.1 hypothetical protein CA984_33050 [Streptosporangium minutum]